MKETKANCGGLGGYISTISWEKAQHRVMEAQAHARALMQNNPGHSKRSGSSYQKTLRANICLWLNDFAAT